MADVLTPILLFIMGLILLGKGSDYFVESAARIAKYFGVSEFIIGLTLIAAGTSLPELGASIIAAYSGNPEIVLGNVIGSNIANIGLILGISAVITTLLVDPEIFKRDMYLLMGVSIIFYLFVLDAVVSTSEGILLLLFFLLYISFLFKFKPRFVRVFRFRQYFDYYFDFNQMLDLETYTRILMKSIDPRTHIRLMKIGVDVGLTPLRIAQKGLDRGNHEKILEIYREKRNREIIKESAILVLSGLAIFVGASIFIDGAVEIASILKIPQSIIGLTMVSIGTSLPELTVAVTSARKGFGNMVLGNIIGSNIANISLVAGVSALITPIVLAEEAIFYVVNITLPFMLMITLLTMIFLRSGWVVRKWEGLTFLMLYFSFLTYIILCFS